MAEELKQTFEVVCPCCEARLTIDPDLKAILHHEEKPKAPPVASLPEAVKALKTEAGYREARFKEAMEAEKDKRRVLEKKFQELLKKAKDEPSQPPRPVDFD